MVEFLEPRLAPANVDVLTWHNDNTLSGLNNQETILTPANVNSTNFGVLFTYPVDGYVYAQPLYKSNLTLPDGSTHNVVFVATEHDSVYAFDGDTPSGGANNDGLLWHVSFIDPANRITPVPSADISTDITPEVGITGTPVIDPNTNTLYVVAKTKEVRNNVAHYVQKLYAIDITTGNKLRSVTIGDSTSNDSVNVTDIVVTGANTGRPGDTSPPTGGASTGEFGGNVPFNARRQHQRSATVLAPPDANHPNGVIYLDFASHGDQGPYRGWVIGYDPQTFALQQFFLTALDSRGSGIWQSGAPVGVDSFNNLYFATGNGFSVPASKVGPRNLTESVVRISTDPSTGQLKLDDWFIPYNWQSLDQADLDLGSGGTMLLPDAVGSAQHPHLIVETGKEGRIYLLDRDDLGHLSPNKGAENLRVVDVLDQGVKGVWGSPAFFQDGPDTGLLYYHATTDWMRAFRITNGHFVRGTREGGAVDRTNNRFGFPGAQPSISANGTQDGIVWELQTEAYGSSGPAVLHAYDALNLAKELYRSDQEAVGTVQSGWLRDQLGPATKFTVPTITNGHVYAGTGNSISVFGLFDPTTDFPAVPSALTVTALSGTQVQLSWTNNAANATGIRIFRSTDGTNFTRIATLPRYQNSFTDTRLAAVTVYYYRVAATNQVGDSGPSNIADIAIDHSGGFSQHGDLAANGSALFTEGLARLTIGGFNEAGTVFSNRRLRITDFTTTFTFRIHEGSDPRGEGFTFIIQGNGPAQLGQGGGGLGYAGIGTSVAIKFDLFKPAGNHSSTGLYINGDSPNNAPDIQPDDVYVDLDGTPIDFNNQHTKQVDLKYDGTTLTETITDTVTGDSFTTSYTVDIRTLVGSDSAFVGFGAGTSDPSAGGGTCLQDIQTWTFQSPFSVPGTPSNLNASVNNGQVMLTWNRNSFDEDGFNIEQSTDGLTFVQITTVGHGVITYTDTPAQPGTYYYRVNAFNVAGVSDYSNIIQVDVPPPPPGGGGGAQPRGPRLIPINNPALAFSTLDLKGGINSDALFGNAVPASLNTMNGSGKDNSVAPVPVAVSTTSTSMDGQGTKANDSALVSGILIHDLLNSQLKRASALASTNALDLLFALGLMEVS